MTPVIFYRDLRIGLRNLWIFPLVLVFVYVVNLLFVGELGLEFSFTDILSQSGNTLFGLGVFLAILAGIAVKADEDNAGTSIFLARLPISSRRVFTEKFLAGLAFLLTMYVLSIAFYRISGAADLAVSNGSSATSIGNFELNLFVSLYSAYLFSLGFSYFLKQNLTIFFSAIAAEFLLWTLLSRFFSDVAMAWEGVFVSFVYLALCFGVPGLLAWKQWRYPLSPTVWGSPTAPTQLKGLVAKHLSYDALLNIASILLLIPAVILFFTHIDGSTLLTRTENYAAEQGMGSTFFNIVPVISLLLLAAIGANSYVGNDGDGDLCVVYLHPISRSQLFLSKLMAAIPSLLIAWTICWLRFNDDVPLVTLGVLCFFVYVTALHLSLWLRSQLLVILGSTSLVVGIGFLVFTWTIPRGYPFYFQGFAPVHDPAYLASIPLVLLSIGALGTAWEMATNKRFLSSGEKYRAKYSMFGTVASWVSVYVLILLLHQLVEL